MLRALQQHTIQAYGRHALSLVSVHAFHYRRGLLKCPVDVMMLEETLVQMEQLVGNLLQRNQELQANQAELSAALAQIKDENEMLQLQMLEMEERQGAVASRLQALVQRAAGDQVSTHSTNSGSIIASA
ncbi:hypothetical protein [Serpens gallinarum]